MFHEERKGLLNINLWLFLKKMKLIKETEWKQKSEHIPYWFENLQSMNLTEGYNLIGALQIFFFFCDGVEKHSLVPLVIKIRLYSHIIPQCNYESQGNIVALRQWFCLGWWLFYLQWNDEDWKTSHHSYIDFLQFIIKI